MPFVQELPSWLQAGIVDEVDPLLLHKADEAVLGQVVDEEEGVGDANGIYFYPEKTEVMHLSFKSHVEK